MLEMTVIMACVITLIFLKVFLNISFKKMKNLDVNGSEEVKKIADKFPEDEEMAKDILKNLNNETVKVKIEPEYNSCLYTVFNNTITIGKFQQNYMKLQTIAHECIHSCQNKRMLWSNFIFTNIYLLYFVIVLVLTFFNKLPYTNIHIIVLIFASIIQYAIRFALENEAMIKAKYIAKEYLEEKKLLTKEEKEMLLEEYDRVNVIGVPFMNYYLMSMNIVKVLIYAFVCLI